MVSFNNVRFIAKSSESSSSEKISKILINSELLLFDDPDKVYHSKIKLNSISIGKWEFDTNVKCMICWKPIIENEKTSRCQGCKNKFHHGHWKNWIDTKHACPVCKTKPNQ